METQALKRDAARDRKRKQRAREKAELDTVTLISGAYSNKASQRKVGARASKSLPISPRKRMSIIVDLSKSFSPRKRKQISESIHPLKCARLEVSSPNRSTTRQGRPQIHHSVQNVVVEYFLSDLVSKVMPGRRDYKTILNEEGQKVRVQKRQLLMYLKEAYADYCKEQPDKNVSFSKFKAPSMCSVNSKRSKLLYVQVSRGCGHDTGVCACPSKPPEKC